MYQVLYRKYRPKAFADVVGQPQVTVTLKNELMQGRISHAYLFTGSRGTGKTTCAKILAKAVNCLSPKEGDPCGECEICRGLDAGSIMDVMEIDAASNNGVDSIRALIEESNFTPASAKYRVYIIDEVHMLSVAAFNALLKTLEEPPAHVIFILATTEVHKLLPTILSRCQRFDFRRIPPESIADRLEQVCALEGAQVEREAALLIARIADGALRDALSLLDQCLGRSCTVTAQVVAETAGVAARKYLSSLAQAICDRDAPQALELLDSLHRESKDMSRLCEEMGEYFRGLMLVKTMKNPAALLLVSQDEQQDLTAQAEEITLAAVLHALDTFEQSLQKMRHGNPRTELEMAFVRLCSPALDTSYEALLRRLEVLEAGILPPRPRGERSGVVSPAQSVATAQPGIGEKRDPVVSLDAIEPSNPAATSSKAELSKQTEKSGGVEEFSQNERSVPAELSNQMGKSSQVVPSNLLGDREEGAALEETAPWSAPPPEEESGREELASSVPRAKRETPKEKGESLSIETLSEKAEKYPGWPEILQVVKGTTKSVSMAFAGSSAYIIGDYMLIEAPEIAFEMLKRSEQRERMRDAIREVTGRPYRLGPYRKPQHQKDAVDSLEALTQRAREAGIAVKVTSAEDTGEVGEAESDES